jgi:hypothetical protein
MQVQCMIYWRHDNWKCTELVKLQAVSIPRVSHDSTRLTYCSCRATCTSAAHSPDYEPFPRKTRSFSLFPNPFYQILDNLDAAYGPHAHQPNGPSPAACFDQSRVFPPPHFAICGFGLNGFSPDMGCYELLALFRTMSVL